MKGQVFTVAKLHYFNGVVYATAKRGSTDIDALAKLVAETTKSGNAKHPKVRVRTLARFAEGVGLLTITKKTNVTITDLGKRYSAAKAAEKRSLSARQRKLLCNHIASDPIRTKTIHAISSLLGLVKAGHSGKELSLLYAKAIEKDEAWKSDATYAGFTNFGLSYLEELGLIGAHTEIEAPKRGRTRRPGSTKGKKARRGPGNRDAFVAYAEASNSAGSNKASSYRRALDMLGPILEGSKSDFSDITDIWSLDSAEVADKLYAFVLGQQNRADGGVFAGSKSPSYWRYNFYSAAVRSYAEFLRKGRDPQESYVATRLCFKRRVIERLRDNHTFSVITPDGTFQMTKAQFLKVFDNIPKTVSWQRDGIYHSRKPPQKAMQFLVEGAVSRNTAADKPVPEWTDREYAIAVGAYFQMLHKERQRRRGSRSAVNQQLRRGGLSKRTKESVELRMQSISTVLQELCHPLIRGFVPAKHITEGVRRSIRRAIFAKGRLNEEDYESTADPDTLEARVKAVRKKGIAGKPTGQKRPTKSGRQSTTYNRDPLVKAWVLESADGRCELCEAAAPFEDKYNDPYLEAHHVKPLGKGGPDVVENVAALCPNCHQRCHHGRDAAPSARKLRKTLTSRSK